MDVPVIILGLHQFPERYEAVRARLRQFDHQRITVQYGVYGIDEPEALAEETTKWKLVGRRDFTIGQLACTVAHLNALERASLADSPYTLIVEDDLILPNNWPELYRDIMAALPTDADLVYFGWHGAPHSNSSLFFKFFPYCAHCYLVSRSAASRLVQMARRTPLTHTIDIWTVKEGPKNGLISYCVNPNALPPLQYDKSKVRSERADGIAFQNRETESLVPIVWSLTSYYGTSVILILLIVAMILVGWLVIRFLPGM
jgi:GR25 family glycosyltransferase involved in LPS biosynthesis